MCSMDHLCFLCSFIIHWNVGTSVFCLLIYNKLICLAESPCHHISVSMNILLSQDIFFYDFMKMFECGFTLGLHQSNGGSLSDKIIHLLPFNVSMLHKPILPTYHEISGVFSTILCH